MKKGPPKEEKGESAPLWIISFADMISLLMAFFVMLLALSNSQSNTLCENGDGIFDRTIASFNNSINSFGMPGLFGKKLNLDHNRQMKYYPVDANDPNAGDKRIIDGMEEQIKKLFKQAQNSARTGPSTIRGSKSIFTITPILFAPNSAELTASDKEYLYKFCSDVKSSGQLSGLSIIVIGAAPDSQSLRDKWILAAKRSGAVCNYLKQILSDTAIKVFAWGANDAAARQYDSTVTTQQSNKAHIMLSILHQKDNSGF